MNDDDMTNRELFETLSEILYAIVDNMATKKDLEDLRRESKADNARLAAKINNLRIVSA